MNKSETAGGGPLLAEDYRKARKEVSDIVIAPFDENKAKGVGYNLAASMLVYSVNKKQLVKVKENDREVYIEIAPHDTVLTLSHEYLVVDGDIAGTFHSKVRCSAMGLGNVSTTLDPNWRGKLLFSLNNPTKRKIKLVIEEKNDGARKAVGLITMVLYRIAGKEEHITAKELHLDNPPMRTDIWQDLTERPSGIHAQAYEEFQKIVQEITEFEAPKGERHAQLQKVIDTAIEVRQKILRGESIGAIRAATVPTEEALRSSGNIELKEKFDAWNGKFNEKSEDGSYKIKDVAELAKDNALKEMEDKLVQECHYLMLCEDVRLQEEFIQKRIERYWDGQRLTRLLKRMLNYRALAVLSGSVLIAMSFLGIISLDEAVPTLQKLGFVIVPVIVDVVVNLFGVHKPDQKG